MNSSNTNPSNCCIPTTVSDDESSFPDVDDNNNNNGIGNDNGFPWQSRSRELEFPVEASHSNFLNASYPPSGLMYQEQGPIPNGIYPSLFSEPQPSSSTSLGSFSQEQHYASAPEMYPNCTYDMSGFIPANDIPNMAQPQQPEPSTSDDRDGNEDDNFGDPGFAWRILATVGFKPGDWPFITPQRINLTSSKKKAISQDSEHNRAKQSRTDAQKEANRIRERARMQSVKNVLNALKKVVGCEDKKIKSKIAVIEEACNLIKVLERKAEEKRSQMQAGPSSSSNS